MPRGSDLLVMMGRAIYAVVAASLVAVSIPSQNVLVSAQNVAGKLSVKLADGAGSKSSQSRRRRPFWKRRAFDVDDSSSDGESSSFASKTSRCIERLTTERGIGTLILSILSLLAVYASSWKHSRNSKRNRTPESIGIEQDVNGQGERNCSSNSVQ